MQKNMSKTLLGESSAAALKRKRLQAQLLSDISMRIKQGETLEEIIQSMGSPQEIADAFSQICRKMNERHTAIRR